jgi:dethiobiotin synthetase
LLTLNDKGGRMSLRFGCFVTGTDTGVGKTLISAALVHKLASAGVRSAGMKPLAAGAEIRDGALWNEDVAMLTAQASVRLPVELVCPLMFREAAAPHIAATLEDRDINIDTVMRAYRQISAQVDALVVEGVGGFRVPLTDQLDTADLATAMQLDVILVVGLRLGCLNHALLTAEAIAARGLTLAGWVANQIDPAMPHQAANLDTLSQRLPAPLLGVVRWMPVPSAAEAAASIDASRLPGWPATR